MVALEQSVGIVVDRFAGAIQKSGCRVFFAENQVCVRLAALQGDPHRHLADRASRQRIRAGKRLRAQQDVDAKRTTLSHQSIQQQ